MQLRTRARRWSRFLRSTNLCNALLGVILERHKKRICVTLFNSSRAPTIHTHSTAPVYMHLATSLPVPGPVCSLSCSHSPLQLPPFLLPLSPCVWMSVCHRRSTPVYRQEKGIRGTQDTSIRAEYLCQKPILPFVSICLLTAQVRLLGMVTVKHKGKHKQQRYLGNYPDAYNKNYLKSTLSTYTRKQINRKLCKL